MFCAKSFDIFGSEIIQAMYVNLVGCELCLRSNAWLLKAVNTVGFITSGCEASLSEILGNCVSPEARE